MRLDIERVVWTVRLDVTHLTVKVQHVDTCRLEVILDLGYLRSELVDGALVNGTRTVHSETHLTHHFTRDTRQVQSL